MVSLPVDLYGYENSVVASGKEHTLIVQGVRFVVFQNTGYLWYKNPAFDQELRALPGSKRMRVGLRGKQDCKFAQDDGFLCEKCPVKFAVRRDVLKVAACT
jgi:hypothetical protein